MNDSVAKLRDFFSDPHNTVTRERIFFNRLSFDLTIAAAREGYHLYLYEPNVDRDGFDIVAQDEDRVGWYQTKAVLSKGGAASWAISVGFLRPLQEAAEHYGFDPVDAGRGGGVILIEIDEEATDGGITYRYTDFDILAAIAEGFLTERLYTGPGRPAEPARNEARDVISQLRTGKRNGEVTLTKKLFVTVPHPDYLLGLMGLRSGFRYGTFAIRAAYGTIHVDEGGVASNAHTELAGPLHYHMEVLCSAQPTSDSGSKVVLFDPFTWTPQKLG